MKTLLYLVLATSLIALACKSDNTQHANTQVAANGRDTTITFSGAEFPTLPSGWSSEKGNWEIAFENSNRS
jgi:hypothetical protein